MASEPRRAPELLNQIILSVFRLNASLLQREDELVAPLRLTGSRWQVLGAVALGRRPMNAPQIAEAMGLTRQGVQKHINLMLAEGLLESQPNPRHTRSPLFSLTQKGQRAFESAMELQVVWAKGLTTGLNREDLETTMQLLNSLSDRLYTTSLPIKER